MDIQVGRFREVLELLKPVVPRKSTLESVTCIMLKDGQAIATDMETMVITPVPEVDLTTLVPIADVAKLLHYTRGGELLHIEGEPGKLSLSWPGGSASFPVKEPEMFPPVPEFVPEVEESLNTDILIPALVSILGYAAKDDARPILAGVNLILGDPVRVAAGDGFRLADKVLKLSFQKDLSVILPRNSVSLLKHLWEKTPRTPPPAEALVQVLVAKKFARVAYADKEDKQALRFEFERGTTAIIKLVGGKYPDYLKLIPKGKPKLEIQVFAPDLELAVRRVAGVAKAGLGGVTLEFEDGQATISAKHEDQEIKTTITTLGSKGVPARIALSADYLTSYLSGKPGLVTIAHTGKTAPVTFQSQNDPRVLIMPMQLKEEPAKPAEPAETETETGETETETGETETEPEEQEAPVD